MLPHGKRNGQSAERAEVELMSLQPLAVQLLVPELSYAQLARLLVLLAMCFLTVHAAVLDEAAGIAVLELDVVAPVHAAIGAGRVAITVARHAAH